MELMRTKIGSSLALNEPKIMNRLSESANFVDAFLSSGRHLPGHPSTSKSYSHPGLSEGYGITIDENKKISREIDTNLTVCGDENLAASQQKHVKSFLEKRKPRRTALWEDLARPPGSSILDPVQTRAEAFRQKYYQQQLEEQAAFRRTMSHVNTKSPGRPVSIEKRFKTGLFCRDFRDSRTAFMPRDGRFSPILAAASRSGERGNTHLGHGYKIKRVKDSGASVKEVRKHHASLRRTRSFEPGQLADALSRDREENNSDRLANPPSNWKDGTRESAMGWESPGLGVFEANRDDREIQKSGQLEPLNTAGSRPKMEEDYDDLEGPVPALLRDDLVQSARCVKPEARHVRATEGPARLIGHQTRKRRSYTGLTKEYWQEKQRKKLGNRRAFVPRTKLTDSKVEDAASCETGDESVCNRNKNFGLGRLAVKTRMQKLMSTARDSPPSRRKERVCTGEEIKKAKTPNPDHRYVLASEHSPYSFKTKSQLHTTACTMGPDMVGVLQMNRACISPIVKSPGQRVGRKCVTVESCRRVKLKLGQL
jgi:hypothetical protein